MSGILATLGKLLIEFAKTLIIDTVIQAILNPHNNVEKKTINMRSNFVCL